MVFHHYLYNKHALYLYSVYLKKLTICIYIHVPVVLRCECFF